MLCCSSPHGSGKAFGLHVLISAVVQSAHQCCRAIMLLIVLRNHSSVTLNQLISHVDKSFNESLYAINQSIAFQEELKMLRLRLSLLMEEELGNREHELVQLLEMNRDSAVSCQSHLFMTCLFINLSIYRLVDLYNYLPNIFRCIYSPRQLSYF